MEIDIIKTGNSQGICIPIHILNQLGIGDSVDLEVKNHALVLRPKSSPKTTKKPRSGWDKAFAKHASNNGEELLDGYVPTKFDGEEWQW